MPPQASFTFPRGFLWGTATAAHQVEGQNHNNNWSRWEEERHILYDHRSGLAADWWGGRWAEDFDRAVATGQNAHRLSIEWSRIQPEPERWDDDALDFYRQMVSGLVERGLTPMVTLHHFTDPLWLYERGGWEDDETPQQFARFVMKVVGALKDYTNLWVTINEPNVYVQGGYLGGGFPPGKNDLATAFKVMHNLVRGHAYAYKAIHYLQPNARVGIAINYRGFQPARSWLPLDSVMAGILSSNFNDAFNNSLVNGRLNFAFRTATIPEAVKTQDFIGLNYYTVDQVAFNLLKAQDLFHTRFYPSGALLSDTGFLANRPEGMFQGLRWANRYNLPIIVTENGVEDQDDDLRPRYLVEHLHQVWRALVASIPVKGYFHWSLVDNFEWERGWTQRFGLWGLDLDTQARIRRASVDLYAGICKENAITSELVEQYTPQIYSQLFPG